MSLYEIAAPTAVWSPLRTTWPATESMRDASLAFTVTVAADTVRCERSAAGAVTLAETWFWVWLTTTEPAPENCSALPTPRATPSMWVDESASTLTAPAGPVATSTESSTRALTVLPIRFCTNEMPRLDELPPEFDCTSPAIEVMQLPPPPAPTPACRPQ